MRGMRSKRRSRPALPTARKSPSRRHDRVRTAAQTALKAMLYPAIREQNLRKADLDRPPGLL
jgi:ribosomal protein L20